MLRFTHGTLWKLHPTVILLRTVGTQAQGVGVIYVFAFGVHSQIGDITLLCEITWRHTQRLSYLNRLTPIYPYMGRAAPLTSKRCILYIYATNVVTEYFKHALYSPFFLFKMQFVS